MHNPWLAIQAGADPAERQSSIRLAYEAFLSSGELTAGLRTVVADSWCRSRAARVDPEHGLPPVSLVDGDLEDYRSDHPLAAVLPMLRQLLGEIADDGRHLMAVSDAAGRLLWVEGHPSVRAGAARMNFVEGALWDERHAGTNAPGTALAVDHAVQIFASEHFSRMVQPWTCSAAPIHDPATGDILGVIDVTGGDHLAVPVGLALVQATARAVEAELARSAAAREHRLRARYLDHVGRHAESTALVDRAGRILVATPGAWPSGVVALDLEHGRAVLPGGREAVVEPFDDGGAFIVRRPGPPATPGAAHLRLTCLGRGRLTEDGGPLPLRPRQVEILALLVLERREMTHDRLREALYGERHVSPATLKAEVSHLRRILGGALSTGRYELTVPIGCDAVDLLDALRAGRPDEALRHYRGPLLPDSDAPGIAVWRDHIDVALREAVLCHGDPDAVLDYGELHPEDLQVHERALDLLDRTDPRRAVALAHHRRTE